MFKDDIEGPLKLVQFLKDHEPVINPEFKINEANYLSVET